MNIGRLLTASAVWVTLAVISPATESTAGNVPPSPRHPAEAGPPSNDVSTEVHAAAQASQGGDIGRAEDFALSISEARESASGEGGPGLRDSDPPVFWGSARGTPPGTAPPHMIHQFDLAGTYTSVSINQDPETDFSAWGYRDGCSDGTYVYFGWEDGVRRHHGLTGELDPAWGIDGPAPEGVGVWRALAFDPALDCGRGGFWTASFASPLIATDMEGNLVRGPYAGEWSLYGLAYDHQTGNLWGHDAGCSIIEIDRNTGAVLQSQPSPVDPLCEANGGLAMTGEGYLIGIAQGQPDSAYSYDPNAMVLSGPLSPNPRELEPQTASNGHLGIAIARTFTPKLMEPASTSAPAASPSGCGPCSREEERELLSNVHLFSGEYHDSVVDLEIPGRGTNFVWSRSYRSRVGPDTAIGNGWDFSYNIRVEQHGLHRVVSDGNTRQDMYTLRPDGRRVASELFRELNEGVGRAHTLTFPDTGTWEFHPLDGSPLAGRLSSIVGSDGNPLSFEYDGDGRLISVIDTLDRTITFAYNAHGFLESVTDFTGRSVTYEYYDGVEPGGGFGDLKSVTTPAVTGTPTGNDFPNGKTTTYTYTTGFGDERLNHDLLTVTDPKGQLYLQNVYAHTISPDDPRYTQDPASPYFDRVVRQVWGDPDDVIDLVYAPQDPHWDDNCSTGMVIVNDRMGNVTELYYNSSNRRVLRREYTGRADPDQPTTETENRPTGQLRPEDPPSFDTSYEYNHDSLVTRIVHPNLNEETFVYDENNPEPRYRGNLLEHCLFPGPLEGDQTQICEMFEYDPRFAGCGGAYVTREVDAQGNETLHTYDENGNRLHTQHRIPTSVEDWEYNPFGQVTAHVLPDNGSGHRRRDEYTYYTSGPQAGYLHEEIVDAGSLSITTTRAYDDLGRMISLTDPRGHDNQLIYNQLNQVVREISREVSAGTGLRYQRDTFYDENDIVVRVDVQNIDDQGALQPNTHFTTIFEHDILNKITREAHEVDDTHAVVTEYEYDANRNQTLVRFGEAVNGNDPANTVSTIHDERDLVFQVIRAEGDTDQSTTQYDYDGNENLTRVSTGTESAPCVRTFRYDGYDRIWAADGHADVDAMGNTTEYHYDPNDNRLSVRMEGELVDVGGSVSNVRLYEATYQYDAMDRLIQTTVEHFDPATQTAIGDGQSVTLASYNDNSQVVQTTDDNGRQTGTTYDTANRVGVITDAKNNTVTLTYDAGSNVLTRTEVEKSDLGSPDETFVTTEEYDGLDRLIQTVDNAGNTTSHGYDSRDNETVTVDALEHETRHVYDGLSRLTATARDMNGDGADLTDSDDIVTTHVWDDSSRLLEQTDDSGNTTSYAYDSLDRLTSTTYADGTLHTTTYDVHNNPIQTVDANGSLVTSVFDMLNRPSNRSITPGAGVSSDTTFVVLDYDGLSRLVLGQDDDSLVTRSYDSMSNLTGESRGTENAGSVYDGEGNQLTCNYPGGRIVTKVYDELDRPQAIADQAGAIATYAYIGPGRTERCESANDVRTDFEYDLLKRITRTTHTFDPLGVSDVIDDRTYGWDAMYNKTSRSNQRLGGLTHTYNYDPVYRLTRSLRSPPGEPAGRVDYDLDGTGNRVQVLATGAESGEYFLDPLVPPADRPVNQYTATPRTRREYDDNGNLIRITAFGDVDADGAVDLDDHAEFVACMTGPDVEVGAPCRRLDADHDNDVDLKDFAAFQANFTGSEGHSPAALIDYDYRNRMVEFADAAAGLRHAYSYDALGRRIVRVTDADGMAGGPTETRYYYDDWQVIEEQDDAGVTTATYVYGRYVDEVLNRRQGPDDLFYHADDLYNVMAVTDANGEAVERYDYADYGAPTFEAYGRAPNLDELYDSDGQVAPYGAVQKIADSFVLTGTAAVTGVRWWGGYSYDVGQPERDDFTLRIYADDGGLPGSLLWEEHVGNDVTRSATGLIIGSAEGDVPEFFYEAGLDVPFEAEPDTTYWLLISNDTTGHPTIWGWEESGEGDGQLAWTHDGGPWGSYPADTAFVLFTRDSIAGNSYLFNGRRFDPETGMYYYRTRYMDPATGRFTARDTIGIWGDEGNLGNGYTYAGNNPWSKTDPMGLKKHRKSEQRRREKELMLLAERAMKDAERANRATARAKNHARAARQAASKARKAASKAGKAARKARKAAKKAEGGKDRDRQAARRAGDAAFRAARQAREAGTKAAGKGKAAERSASKAKQAARAARGMARRLQKAERAARAAKAKAPMSAARLKKAARAADAAAKQAEKAVGSAARNAKRKAAEARSAGRAAKKAARAKEKK